MNEIPPRPEEAEVVITALEIALQAAHKEISVQMEQIAELEGERYRLRREVMRLRSENLTPHKE